MACKIEREWVSSAVKKVKLPETEVILTDIHSFHETLCAGKNPEKFSENVLSCGFIAIF
jgi:hypothetical protein